MKQRSPRAPKGAPTIADVAKAAGYSPMTVSRVINGEKNVSMLTRQTILDAIKAMNYSPNLAARSLAGADQIKIAMLYGNPSAAYLSRLLVGTLEQARKSHVQLLIEQCDTEQDIESVFQNMVENDVDGIFLSPPLCDSPRMLELLENSNITSVVVANWSPPGKMSVVNIDDVEASATMTQHLVDLGHKKIGFVIGNPEQKASWQRLEGYKKALQTSGIALDPDYMVQGLFTYRSGLDAAEKLLNLPHPPTAIFASNDDMAAAAITVAHRMHLDVPKDVTVCGFDDTDFALSIWPELTTIHQPIADMSRIAVEILVDQIKSQRSGRGYNRIERKMDFTFIRRESDGPPLQDSGAGV